MEEKHVDSSAESESSQFVESSPAEGWRYKFPKVGDVFAMLGIFLVAQVVGTMVGALVVVVSGVPMTEMSPEAVGRLLAISGLVSYGLMLVGILVYRRLRGGRGPIAHLSIRGLNPLLLLWGVLFLVAIGVVLEPLLELLPQPPMEGIGRGVWTFVALVVFAPVFEELICRGIVLESLRARYGVVAAWFFSSLFFGVVHLQPMLVVNAFFMGMILAYLYIRTNSLWIAIILHAVNNAIAYLLLVTGHNSMLLSDMIGNHTLYVAVYVIALVLCVVSGWMVWRRLREIEQTGKNLKTA